MILVRKKRRRRVEESSLALLKIREETIRRHPRLLQRLVEIAEPTCQSPEQRKSLARAEHALRKLRIELPPEGLDLEQVVADLEKHLMTDALEKAGWVQAKAAQLLGINLRSFRYRAKKHGLDRQIRDRSHAEP